MEEQQNKQIEEPKLEPIKKQYVDKLKLRCPRCFHMTAIRNHNITNIKEAVYFCENCGRIVKK